MQETWIRSLGQEDHWRGEWLPTLIFLPGESHRQRSLEVYSLWGRRVRCYWATNTTTLLGKGASQVVLVVKIPPANAGDIRDADLILGLGRTLEKEMAPHSSILAWRIPWTGEPGRLQSIVSHRVSHDWSNLVCTHALVVEFDSSHFQEREARNRNPFGIFREQFPLTAGHREKLWFPNQFSTAKKNLCPPANRWAPSDNSTGASQVAQC